MSDNPWPDDDEPVSFEAIITPARAALLAAYKLERLPIPDGIPWDGLAQGKLGRAQIPQPSEALSAENLQENEEDQGRDPLDVILGIVVQLGIEQGRRITKKRLVEGLEPIVGQIGDLSRQLEGLL